METLGKTTHVKIDHFKKYATGRDALADVGYTFVGTYKTKMKEHEIFFLGEKLFALKKCVIERYEVKELLLSDFNGSPDLIELQVKKEPVPSSNNPDQFIADAVNVAEKAPMPDPDPVRNPDPEPEPKNEVIENQ